MASETRITSCRAIRPLYPVREHAEHPAGRKIVGISSPGLHGNRDAIISTSLGRYASLHFGHSRRASRWATTQSRAEPTRNGSMPISMRRVIALGASLVCRVESTRWPVRAASMAICAVSWSRISPISTTSGSDRRIERSALAKVRPALGLTCTWLIPGMRYSPGASTVMTLLSGRATACSVARPEINVITVEDPVEYRIPGINQVQVNPKAGLTFASALRSILRSDPDVVLIGEIRDHETAQIAIEAALTGHLVLSTLHTNDAPSAITRLIEMGIEPFLVGSALDCVVAQRLARRLCPKCKEAYQPSEVEMSAARFPWSPGEEIPTLYRHAGCSACSRTGYKGRMAIHEVMRVSEEIERLAVSHASAAEIAGVAREQGMITLRDDGWTKVLLGDTSVEEILRVVA